MTVTQNYNKSKYFENLHQKDNDISSFGYLKTQYIIEYKFHIEITD